MDIREQILKEHSKANAKLVVEYIGTNTQRFDELMQLFLANEYRVTQRAAQVVGKCADLHPDLLAPWLKVLVNNLYNPNLHDAVKRSTVRLFQFIKLPHNLHGKTAEICFQYLASMEEAIAIKVFSMQVLANLCKTHPELVNELLPLIKQQLPYGSTGFKNRGKKILKELERLQYHQAR